MSEAARRRRDPRLVLVGLAFLAAAGFLGLHALATPGVLLEAPNTGFAIATPVGLVIAALFAFVSSLDLSERTGELVVQRQRALRTALVLVLAAWAAVSLASLPPLDQPLPQEEARLPLRVAALVAVGLYGAAAWRYRGLLRATGSTLPLAVLTAFVLLSEAMISVAFSRNWQLSWWEWHVLMAFAFGLVAVAARAERRQARPGGAFSALYLEQTLARANAAYADALREVVERRATVQEVASRFGLSGEQAALVERAAERIRQLDAAFRPHVSPSLAARLERTPELGALGGEEREVSVLFADLEGFTSYSEGRPAGEVIAMLNEYWGLAVPLVLEEHGGVIERFQGDAVLVAFNVAGDQPDHARRAAATALHLQERCEEIRRRRPDWPGLRAGVNTGPAAVGYVGAEQQRSFSVIGDTTNTAARLQSAARPGEVVISASTRAQLGDAAHVEGLTPIEAKGKREPVPAFRLVRLDGR